MEEALQASTEGNVIQLRKLLASVRLNAELHMWLFKLLHCLKFLPLSWIEPTS